MDIPGAPWPWAIIRSIKQQLYMYVQPEAVMHPDATRIAYSTVLVLCHPSNSWRFMLDLRVACSRAGLCHTIDEIVEALERVQTPTKPLRKMFPSLVGWAGRSYGDGYAVSCFWGEYSAATFVYGSRAYIKSEGKRWPVTTHSAWYAWYMHASSCAACAAKLRHYFNSCPYAHL